MSESLEIKTAKIDSLVAGFKNSGFKSGDRVGQTELIQFLDRRSSSGRFDPIISEKLFQVLSLESMNTLSVEEFINGFLQFEEELRKNAELFAVKFAKEEEIYAKVAEECRKYKEKLNEEGLSEDAKVYGEITEIDIKRKLEGIREIIIRVVFNEKSEELHFKIGDLNSSSEMANKSFQFKPTSRKDHFEFIMKGINERNQVFDIGSKVFPLTEVNSQEEYLVQIVVPEIENEEQIAAYIKAKIVLYWSDYKLYEKQKKKAESKLKKLTIAKNKAEEYLRKVREIYGDLTRKKPDLIVDFNNEKLMQKKGAKLNVNFNNTKEADGNYIVEFNNQKEVQIKEVIEKETKVEETKVEETKEEPVVEPTPEINTQPVEVNVAPEEYQNTYETNEQINYEQYGNEVNYETNYDNNYETNYQEYQTTGYEEAVQENYDLQNTEIIKETEIRSSVHDAVIRQSLNQPLVTENTLPVIRQEKVNKVIYTNVTTLPLIYGEKKVTYLSEAESKNFDFGSLTQGEQYNTTSYNTPIVTQEYNQISEQTPYIGEVQDYNQIGEQLPHITQVEDYNQTQAQDFIGTQTQDFTQISQAQDFTQINPEHGVNYEEYPSTTY